SILLAVLADTLGDEVVFEKCALERVIPQAPPAPALTPAAQAGKPATPALKAPKAPPPLPSWTLRASGLGRDPQAVSQFILRLESSGLFDSVTLLKTSR